MFKIHLLWLPRWFGAPVALSSVALGGILVGIPGWRLALAMLCGVLLMAYAHSVNSWYDYAITGFDKGPPGERSRRKPYTGAQNLLAEGTITVREVVGNSAMWFCAAIGAAIPIAAQNPWFWLPFGSIALCAPLYSEAKKFWCCETVLGLGFGPFAVALGAAAGGPGAELGRPLLAGIPLAIMFGFAAETVDQAQDAATNVGKGLRNLGMLAWRRNVLAVMLALEIAAAYVSLLVLSWVGVLSWWTLFLALPAYAPLAYCIVGIKKRPGKAIKVGLVGVFLFGALIATGQWAGSYPGWFR